MASTSATVSRSLSHLHALVVLNIVSKHIKTIISASEAKIKAKRTKGRVKRVATGQRSSRRGSESPSARELGTEFQRKMEHSSSKRTAVESSHRLSNLQPQRRGSEKRIVRKRRVAGKSKGKQSDEENEIKIKNFAKLEEKKQKIQDSADDMGGMKLKESEVNEKERLRLERNRQIKAVE